MAAPTYIGTKPLGVGPANKPIIGAAPLTASSNAPMAQLTPALSGVGTQPGGDYTDNYGNKFRYVDYGNGTGEWLQVGPSGDLQRPGDQTEINRRLSGTSIAGNSSGVSTPAGNQSPYASTWSQATSFAGGSGMGMPANAAQQQAINALAPNPQSQNWQNMIGGATGAAIGGRNFAAAQQGANTTDYMNSLNGFYNQQAGYVGQANAADQAALGAYNTQAGQQYNAISALSAPTWQNYNSNPQDVAQQQQSYNWANGVAGGSLNYSAAQAALSQASYRTYQAQQAQLALAQLHQYASNPQDIQRQLTGLGQISKDIATGGAGQEKILRQIYDDLAHGGAGQKDAIARLQQELDTGGNDQREVMAKYKALSDPNITAQERYLAEIARRSFEAQDKGSREAVLSDQAARGVRSGASEIASNLANQERFGQDRTLSELGLQANAVQRSMQALGGWQGSADSLRAAQQNGLAMYTQAQNALRAAQQNGMGLAANEENALREASQRGLAMYQQAADSIRAMNDQVGLANTNWANQNSMFNADASNQNSMFNANATNQASQFNANAYNTNSMFNAGQANQVGMFNAGQTNQAYANNQQTMLSGGIQAGNMANSIRSMNDAIGMFNTQGSQTSQQFAANFGLNQQGALNGITQQGFNNATGATNAAFGRNSGLTAFGAQNAGNIFGAQTTNNSVQGNLGSANLGTLLTGLGGIQGIQATDQAGALARAGFMGLGLRPGTTMP